MSREEAVDRAIDECIEEEGMADFLKDQRADVQSMSILECDYEEELKKIKKSYFERGEYDTIKIQISKKTCQRDN